MMPSRLNRHNSRLWERDCFGLDRRGALSSVAVIIIVLVGSGLVANLWYEGLLHPTSTKQVDSIVRWRL
jgi:hypothetical protein